MNIRAVTVERGIATLAHQSRPSILFSFVSLGGWNRHNAGVGEVGFVSVKNSVNANLPPTGIQVQENELEGGYDGEEDEVGFEDRDDDKDEHIIQEDRRSVIGGEKDVERGAS